MSTRVVHISSDENGGVPSIPAAIVDAESTETILRTLRHFHLGNPSAKQNLKPVSKTVLPALLDPFRDTTRLRYDYPLFLIPPSLVTPQMSGSELAKPLGQVLSENIELIAPNPDAAKILKDNVSWIEREVRIRLRDQEGPVPAKEQIRDVASGLITHLKLDSDNQQKLTDDIEKLINTLPDEGQLLSYGRYPAIHLLIHVISCKITPRHDQFLQEIDNHIAALKDLLDVDWNKSEEAIKPEKLESSIGASSSMFDSSRMSKIMKHSQGSVVMAPERKQRIEHALDVLESYKHQNTFVRFVHNGSLHEEFLEKNPTLEVFSAEDPCETATELFDKGAAKLAAVFKAIRTADLEMKGKYDPAIHDPWFENFGWEAFSHKELTLVPAVIAFESADHAATHGLASFSKLLNSGRPVQIFVRVQAHNNPGAGMDEDPFQSFRTELGYLGISHRQAVVSQSSAARHQHLLNHYTAALDATRTSLHLINIGLRPTGQNLGLNAWLVAGAALEGRVHPFFFVNPSAGDSGAEKFDFSGNPQPERDWPRHPFKYKDFDGNPVETELEFTFADYALLIERLHGHFAQIPPECNTDDLIAVADFLQLSDEQAYQKIPFIWTVDENNTLIRLVVTRALIQACKDRLNFWHSLQEFSGVRNRYVDIAVKQTREELEEKAQLEREELIKSHQQELGRVRAESASEVMGRLTDVLMGMDFTQPPGKTSATSFMKETAPQFSEEIEKSEEAVEELQIVEEEEEIIEEAWIDSGLCTSCNDCLAINPLLFVYNENNQAYLSDLSNGTYAQLVEGAELCPSKCIHPGLPVDKSEANLDELIARAAPFN